MCSVDAASARLGHGTDTVTPTGGRPGRLQRIAQDGTPINAAQPDINARIGWLLAMSRLHHPDPSFGDGRVFVEALGDVGQPTSRSLLSRWESGEIPVSYEGMSAYEQVLGLPRGTMSSITGYIRATMPGVRARVVRPKLDPTTREFSRQTDELIEKAEDGTASAADWQELGWALACVPLVHLRASTWERVAHHLVFRLPRTTKLAYRQYTTAATNLATVERAQDYLVDAIKHYLADPGVQVITNPAGLLDRLPTRDAARLTFDLIANPVNDAVFGVSVWIAATKVERKHFTPEERAELDMLVLRLWRSNPAKASETLAELIAHLPEGMRSALVQAATRAGRRKLGYVVEHGEDVVASRARAISSELAEAARKDAPQEPAYVEDQMLARLVREALFHRDSERRHLASMLISASPFCDPLTDRLIDLMSDPGLPPAARARSATLVRYLATDRHRMRLLGFLGHHDEDVAVPIAQGLGHLSYTPQADQALRSSLGKDWSLRDRAKVYALGMTGSPGLTAILKAADSPEWQRTAARWWIEQGPAITS